MSELLQNLNIFSEVSRPAVGSAMLQRTQDKASEALLPGGRCSASQGASGGFKCTQGETFTTIPTISP